MGRPVFRAVRPLVALPRIGWHPYTSHAVKRGVGPHVPHCERLWKSPGNWTRTVPQNRPQPTHHFSTRFLGQSRRSIFARDKFPSQLPAVRTAPRSTVGTPGEGTAETPRWGGCLPFWVGQASRPAIRRPHPPGLCPGTPYPLKGEKGHKCRRRKPKSSPPG